MSRLKNVCLNEARVRLRRGFTLVKVLVALAILSVGAAASGYYYSAFAAMRKRERETVKAVVLATAYIEKTIENPLACVDTNFAEIVGNGINLSVTLRKLPGVAKLAFLDVVPFVGEPVRRDVPVAFRRVVYCK